MTLCYQRHELAPGIHADIPHEHEGVVVKSMAEVIADAARTSDAAHWPEAVEIALMAAGFGLVKAAQEVAWDEGMEAMYATTSSEWPPVPEMNPYHAAT